MVRARAGNRTDLATKVPIATAPDQSYGMETAQQQSQKMLPVAAPPIQGAPPAGPAAPGVGGPGGPAAAPPVDLASVLAGHQGSGPKPGELPIPNRGGPVTSGLPSGPGPGLEAHSPGMQQALATQSNEAGNLSNLLGNLASQPGASSVTKALFARANGGG
jgi:hypothetical protein